MKAQFRIAMENAVVAQIKSNRRAGTTAMERDNLYQMIAGRISRMPGAPAGTNAAYAAKQTFLEVCDSLPGKYQQDILA